MSITEASAGATSAESGEELIRSAYAQKIASYIERQTNLLLLDEKNKKQFESIDRLLEAPSMDMITAILLLGKMTQIQADLVTASKALDMQVKADRLLFMKREVRKFEADISAINKDTEAFINTNRLEEDKGDTSSYSRPRLNAFIARMKSFFSDQVKRMEKAEEDFMESAGIYFQGIALSRIFQHLQLAQNILNSVEISNLPSSRLFEALKWAENKIAGLDQLYGDDAAKKPTIPGTGELTRGLLTIQSSLVDIIKNVATATEHVVSARLRYESDEFELNTQVLTDFLESSSKQFATLHQIIRLYYEGLLDIFTRLRV